MEELPEDILALGREVSDLITTVKMSLLFFPKKSSHLTFFFLFFSHQRSGRRLKELDLDNARMDVDTELDDEEPYRLFEVSFFIFYFFEKTSLKSFSSHNFQENLTASSSSNPENQMNYSMACWSTCSNVNVEQGSFFLLLLLFNIFFSVYFPPFGSFL